MPKNKKSQIIYWVTNKRYFILNELGLTAIIWGKNRMKMQLHVNCLEWYVITLRKELKKWVIKQSMIRYEPVIADQNVKRQVYTTGVFNGNFYSFFYIVWFTRKLRIVNKSFTIRYPDFLKVITNPNCVRTEHSEFLIKFVICDPWFMVIFYSLEAYYCVSEFVCRIRQYPVYAIFMNFEYFSYKIKIIKYLR